MRLCSCDRGVAHPGTDKCHFCEREDRDRAMPQNYEYAPGELYYERIDAKRERLVSALEEAKRKLKEHDAKYQR
jgi:hypothetical protein